MKKIKRKVLDTTRKIVLLSPKQGKLRGIWLKTYAFCSGVPLIDVTDPLQVTMRTIFHSYLDSWTGMFGLSPILARLHEPIIIPTEDWHTKRIKPLSKQFDYALKVLTRTPKGTVLSSTWQLKLTQSSAHLIVISSYFPEQN